MKEIGAGRRLRLLAAAVLTVTFVAGALVGFVGERLVGEVQPQPPRLGRAGLGSQPRARIFARGSPAARRLGLSEDQHSRIDSIFAADRVKAQAILRQLQPRLQARFDSTTAAVRAVLTPEQRVEFRRFRAERRRQLERQFNERSDPSAPL